VCPTVFFEEPLEPSGVSGPLDGVRVLEAGGIGPAPFCTMLLADMGADVVRLIRPGGGDDGLLSRGKRTVPFDLKGGQGPILDLVGSTDVLVEGFRPGVAERLGIGPETACGCNPRLVYARCTGFGQTGPLHSVAGHDINYIALTGVLGLIGQADGPPTPPLNLVGDFAAGGLTAAFGIMCALFERSMSGLGQVIDAAMVDGSAVLATMFFELIARGQHDERRRGANVLDGGAPYYGVYETSDGGWFAVGAVEEPFYTQLIHRLGLTPEQLPDRSDRSRWPELKATMARAFRTRTRREWETVFTGSDACATPVLLPSECPSYTHHRQRSTFISANGISQPAPAPRLSRTPGFVRGDSQASPTTLDAIMDSWRGEASSG